MTDPASLPYLRALSRRFPTADAALAEIGHLEAVLTLPKGTVHVVSDVHGEHKKLTHVVNNASGTLRNSIAQGVDPFSIALDCFMFDFQHNALDNSNFAQGTNTQVPLYDPIQFVDPDIGDFRLVAPRLSPYGDVALWETGDPLYDADGTARPTDGSLGYAGIDEPG